MGENEGQRERNEAKSVKGGKTKEEEEEECEWKVITERRVDDIADQLPRNDRSRPQVSSFLDEKGEL